MRAWPIHWPGRQLSLGKNTRVENSKKKKVSGLLGRRPFFRVFPFDLFFRLIRFFPFLPFHFRPSLSSSFLAASCFAPLICLGGGGGLCLVLLEFSSSIPPLSLSLFTPLFQLPSLSVAVSLSLSLFLPLSLFLSLSFCPTHTRF